MNLKPKGLRVSHRLRKLMLPLLGATLLFASATAQDIIVKKISMSNTNLGGGSYANPAVTLSNIGSGYASYFNTNFYFSSDTLFDRNDFYLNSSYTYSLFKGEDQVLYLSLYIPSETAAGKYYLLAVADAEGYVLETNEKNNTTSIPVEILPPSIDLTIKNLKTNSNMVSPGQAVSLTYEISNTGTSATSYIQTGFYLSADTILNKSFDKFLTSAYEYGLSGNSSAQGYATPQIPANIPDGSYYIIAAADYQNASKETNENNNSSFMKIIVGKSDLLIKSATLSDLSLPSGSAVSAYCFVSNIGDAGVGSVRTGYYLSTDTLFNPIGDVYLSESYLYALPAGNTEVQNASLQVPENIPAGNYYIIFATDHDYAVAEKNESNNTQFLKLTITPPEFDLSINDLVVPSSGTAGSLQSISYSIINKGRSTTARSVVNFYLSTKSTWDAKDLLLFTADVEGVAGNSTAFDYNSFSLPTTLSDGTYYITAVVDPENLIAETNETNNSLSKTIVVGKPDLQINSLNLSSSKAEIGNSVNLFYFLANKGTSAASNISVGYYISKDKTFDANTDIFVGSYYDYFYNTLNGGSSSFQNAVTNKILGMNEGSYYLLVVADYLNMIPETDETNNVAFTPLTLTAPDVDLVITNPMLSTVSASVGDYLNFSHFVKNNGKSASGYHSVLYYLSSDTIFNTNQDQLIGNSYVYDLAGGSSVYQQGNSYYGVPYVTTGNYYVLFVADGNNEVAERNEKNNVAYTALKIKGQSIDLVITKPLLYTTSTNSGAYISYSNNLVNKGTSNAPYSYTGYYLSSDTIFDVQTDRYLDQAFGDGSYGYQSGQLYIPYGLADGKYYILFVADYSGSVAEENETNNVAHVAIDIKGSIITTNPDLYIGYHWTNKRIARPMENVQINLSVVNANWESKTSKFVTAVYLSKDSSLTADDVFLNQHYTSFPSGFDSMTIEARIPYDVTAGSVYYLLYKVDVYDNVVETSEYNNTAYDVIIIDKITSSLASAGETSMKVYPNPASDVLYVELGNSENISQDWQLVNTLGESVSVTPEISGNGLKFNLASLQLAKGLYVLKNSGNGKIIESKITLQ